MPSRGSPDVPAAIIGGGVVGAAVAYALARRGVAAVLLDADDELAQQASGSNSGILHTGFDSPPGELETRLILRSAQLRPAVMDDLLLPELRCGALLRPHGPEEGSAVARLAEQARANGVPVVLRDEGTLRVPGESVTDPVAYTRGLAAAAAGGGADVRTGARVERINRAPGGLAVGIAGGERLTARCVVNCAGLHADAVARLAGDATFDVRPRKGEFFVFEPPDAEALHEILLPVPRPGTKGVLVFPTLEGKVVAGPTAYDQEDKADRSVRPEAWDEVMEKAVRLWPALEGSQPICSYAGLRPAGRECNYVIGRSTTCPGLVNVAAIRSTGLSASLGIGEHVTALVADQGIDLSPDRPLAPGPPSAGDAQPWWRRAADLAESRA